MISVAVRAVWAGLFTACCLRDRPWSGLPLGIGEYLGLLRARYRAGVAYHALRRRVADRRQPAETWGPENVLDVPPRRALWKVILRRDTPGE